MMQEWVVISGKGGTGKTSVMASLAVLSGESRPVLADCDVDAADLFLLLEPKTIRKTVFKSGREAEIDPELCIGCGLCEEYCRFDAVSQIPCSDRYRVNPLACEGCGVCVRFCPADAIAFEECECGELYVSNTRSGTLIHARLYAGAENSGKLVSSVRQEAQKMAQLQQTKHIIIDGPPGIGCPVIASLTGASLVLVVTEPTVSGEHDMLRVLELANHFSIPAVVCVNKWDINPEQTAQIEAAAQKFGAVIAGRIRYDEAVIRAQMEGKSVVETDAPVADDIRAIWNVLNQLG